MRRRTLTMALGLAAALGMGRAAADVVNLGASRDNTLYESAAGALSNGAGEALFAGRTGSGAIRRGLIAFDVASALPVGAVVEAVTLTLSVSRTLSGSVPVTLHRALAAWGEGASDAPGEEGGGAAATVGDATWIHTAFDAGFWASPGGDFDPVAGASQSVGDLGAYTWGSTPGLVEDVQGWLDTPGTNFGWLILGDESAPGTAKRFDSREAALPDARPLLRITFRVVPEPSGLALLGLGTAFALVARRRGHARMSRMT